MRQNVGFQYKISGKPVFRSFKSIEINYQIDAPSPKKQAGNSKAYLSFFGNFLNHFCDFYHRIEKMVTFREGFW